MLRDGRADPRNYPIRLASQNGHTDVVRLLLQDDRVNPASNSNQALLSASKRGHVGVVRLLLQDRRVEPAINDAIRVASTYRHADVVALLFQHIYQNIVNILIENERVNGTVYTKAEFVLDQLEEVKRSLGDVSFPALNDLITSATEVFEQSYASGYGKLRTQINFDQMTKGSNLDELIIDNGLPTTINQRVANQYGLDPNPFRISQKTPIVRQRRNSLGKRKRTIKKSTSRQHIKKEK